MERLLDEHRRCVIDFGAGHSVYEREEDLSRARELLAPRTNVVLLMPSPDLDESIAVLRERGIETIDGVDVMRFALTHPSNRRLSDIVVYTQGRTPAEIGTEVLARLGRMD